MKKALAIIVCLFIIGAVFTACGDKNDDNGESTTLVGTIQVITTDSAKIKNLDAIHLIQSYTDEELALSKEDRAACQFMVATNGVKVDDDYYVEVAAQIMSERTEDGKKVYIPNTKGIYYIRYDGKQILRKDVETGEKTEMKVREVPKDTTTSPHNTSSKETTTADKK